MKPNDQSTEANERCDLCEQKMNPTIRIYNDNTRLCGPCFHHMEKMPDILAKSVERFLIGNPI
jgi:hypothetical protein